MRTNTYYSVMMQVARRLGLQPDENQLSFAQKMAIAGNLTQRAQEAVEFAFWPEWTPCEERQYRDTYAAGQAYVIDDEVFYDDKYYVCILAGTGQTPDVNGSLYWEEQTELDRYVAYEQTGETKIGYVKATYMKNPRTNKLSGRMSFQLSSNGVQISSLAGATVWVEYMRLAPKFSGQDYDETKTYDADAVVYFDTTGDCYRSLASSNTGNTPTDTTYWEKQNILSIWVNWLVQAAYSDSLVADGDSTTKADQLGQAYVFLQNAADLCGMGQEQDRPARFVNR